MGYVYRYIDQSDNIIKYVGIVWAGSLRKRIKQHQREEKFNHIDWKIEYIHENIDSRTDAEYFEAHYISLYGTDKYLNISKSGWGISNYLPDRESEWKEYNELEFCDETNTKSDVNLENANDIFEKIMQCRNDKERKSMFLSFNKRCSYNAKHRGGKSWDEIKRELEKILNRKLFNYDADYASFDGFGRILIIFPAFNQVEYLVSENKFYLRDKKYSIKDIESIIKSYCNHGLEVVGQFNSECFKR